MQTWIQWTDKVQFQTEGTLTIKNIWLNLFPGIAQLVEGIGCLISKSAILDRCNNSDKDIVLNRSNTGNKIQKSCFLGWNFAELFFDHANSFSKAKIRYKIEWYWMIPLSLFHSGHPAAAHARRGNQQSAALCTRVESGNQAPGPHWTCQKFLWWLQLTDQLALNPKSDPCLICTKKIPVRQ